jgi:hypothetical protein
MSLPRLEGDIPELPAQSFGVRLLDSICANMNLPDHLPSLSGHRLDSKAGLHLRWDRMKEHDEGTPILTIVTVAGVDHLPQACNLEVYLHDEGPFHVVCPHERGED